MYFVLVPLRERQDTSSIVWRAFGTKMKLDARNNNSTVQRIASKGYWTTWSRRALSALFCLDHVFGDMRPGCKNQVTTNNGCQLLETIWFDRSATSDWSGFYWGVVDTTIWVLAMTYCVCHLCNARTSSLYKVDSFLVKQAKLPIILLIKSNEMRWLRSVCTRLIRGRCLPSLRLLMKNVLARFCALWEGSCTLDAGLFAPFRWPSFPRWFECGLKSDNDFFHVVILDLCCAFDSRDWLLWNPAKG